MPKKLDILRLFADVSLTPSALANLLSIKQNYARQIMLRLKRQGLVFSDSTFGDQAYSLTCKGEARIIYLSDKEKKKAEGKEREAMEERKQSGMYLHEVIADGLQKEIEKKPVPKPQDLSLEEVLVLNALTKREKGEFLVTKDGEVLYAPGKGYLTMVAAAILAEYRKTNRTK